jgi:hypothetical protein
MRKDDTPNSRAGDAASQYSKTMSTEHILPMVLHGLWDSSLFLSVATGAEPSPTQYAVYPLAIVCATVVLRKNRKPDGEVRND